MALSESDFHDPIPEYISPQDFDNAFESPTSDDVTTSNSFQTTTTHFHYQDKKYLKIREKNNNRKEEQNNNRKEEQKQQKHYHAIPFAPEEPNWERAEILFVLNINAGDRKIPLQIHQNDKPSELAEYFCGLHNLPMGVATQLTKLIHTHKVEFEAENTTSTDVCPQTTTSSSSSSEEEDQYSSNTSYFAPHPPSSPPTHNERLKKTKRRRFRRFQKTTKAPKIIHNNNMKKQQREQNFVPSSPLDNGDGEDETLNQFKLLIDDYYKKKQPTFLKKQKRRRKRTKKLIVTKTKRKKTKKRNNNRKKKKKRRGSGNEDVFKRLHQEHIHRLEKKNHERAEAQSERELNRRKKKICLSKNSKNILKSKGNRGSASVRLYKDAKKKQKKLNEKIKLKKELEEEKEFENVTFHPRISERSANMTRCGSKLWKRIIDPLGDNSKQTLHELREKIIREEMENCPFHPSVNSKSKDLAIAKNKNKKIDHNIYLRLHNEKKLREDAAEIAIKKLKNRHTFHPSISEKSKELSKLKARPPVYKRETNNSCGPIQSRLNELRRKRYLRDPRTGQKYFKPQINHKSNELQTMKRQDVKEYENIGLYLYSKVKE